MPKDWENHYAYLTKKYVEISLDALLEQQADNGAGKNSHLTNSRFLKEFEKDSEELLEDQEKLAEKHKLISEIYSLLSDEKFFTDRQRQVLGLLFGWNQNTYVGPKTVSDIAKVLQIAQPVAFNHLRLAVRKLKKHFNKTGKRK